jgi:hypothetical protein
LAITLIFYLVVPETIIKSNDQGLIEKWIVAVKYAKAEDGAAYLVKAIRENWQFLEEYLRERREEERKEEREKNRSY